MIRYGVALGGVICAALQWAVPASATASALDAFLQSDYKAAFTQYQALAKSGAPNAQAMVGVMLQDGIGADASVEGATAAFEDAAKAGNAVAENGLGYMYDKGRGVGIDFDRSFKLYQSAAQKGFARAQFNLGVMYDLGRGVSKDHSQAFKWYLAAARHGYVPAQNSVGGMYALGEGVQKDPKQAAYWFGQAASAGRDALALGNLGALYALGTGVDKSPERALDFYHKAVAAKDANAEFNLGLMYLKGDGLPKDVTQAVKAFEKAAAGGNERARAVMGLLYATGFGVGKVNLMKAVTLLLTAANNADQAESRTCGIKTQADIDTQNRLAQDNNPRALYCVGVAYAQGIEGLLAPDPAQSSMLLGAAANLGDPGAQYRMGVAAMQKAANPWDSQLAIQWFLASALGKRLDDVPSTVDATQRFLDESEPSISFSLVTTASSAHDLLPGQILLASPGELGQMKVKAASVKTTKGAPAAS
ncbi:MAG TPA: tetratricopeptide repeat protein [Castellaniella sp.]|uniref:tetratricopeptide repeat protein n=1 Tax=Castellaniella sp. TaxID=1955812 RepID=UPI002EEBCFB7